MPLVPAAQKSLTKWLAMIAENDFHDLTSIIAAVAVLGTAAGIFEDFKYHRKFLDDENAALEFSAHIGDVELKAVHLIRFNAAGEFVEIEKLVRPMEGAKALGDAMGSSIGSQIKALRAAA